MEVFSLKMRVLAIIQLLMAWAFAQCIAAPHLLTLLNSGIPSVHDLKNRDVSLGMILGSKQLLRRGMKNIPNVFHLM